MDLTNFKVLSKEQYDALAPKEQALYEIKLEAYNKQEREKEIASVVKAEVEAVKAEIETESATKLETAITAVKDEYDRKLEQAQVEMKRAKEAQNEARGIKTMQEELLEKLTSDEGKKSLEQLALTRKIAEKFESKAVTKPAGSVAPQFAPIVGPGHDAWHARQSIPVFPTESDLIKYVQMTVDPLAEGFKMTAEGTKKGVLNYVPTVKEAPVRKLAGILDISDEFNDDIVGMAAFLAYELPQAYLDAEDLQIFKGNGSGQNLLGLWYQAQSQTLPQGSVSAASNVWDKIAAAITEVRTLKRNTSAVYLNPIDYMELLINKDNEDGYTYPVIMGNDNVLRIGGVPIYWTNVFEEGEGLVGDFARGTAIFQRKAMELRSSDENNDNFEKNMITLRLEGRIALPIYYPEAFKRITLASGT